MDVDDEEEATNPAEVIPGYETDMNAVGVHRRVDPDAVDDQPWYAHFPPEIYDTVELPDDVEVRP